MQVVDSSGASVHYRYDAAGNITGINQISAATLSIVEFTPDAGAVGQSVTIYGSGFSATVGDNTVKFNGATATVTSTTVNKLVATVPEGATTGTIAVTTGGVTATSADSFTVLATGASGPIITGLTPVIGAVGTAVTITGANFSATAANNTVRFLGNGLAAGVSSATSTQLATSVPINAVSGKISVKTPMGTAISPTDFIVPPAGFTAADITTNDRIVIDGASTALNITTSNKVGLLLFDGVQGENLGLGITNAVFTPSNGGATLTIKTPNGAHLFTPAINISGTNFALALPSLPKTGTYTIVVDPTGTNTVNATYTLSRDVAGALVANDPAITFSVARPGQNGRYSFNATAGQNVSILFSGSTFSYPGDSTRFTLYKPDGTPVRSTDSFSGVTQGTLDYNNLPVTGTYKLLVDPPMTSTGQMNLALLAEASGTLTIDGATTAVSLLAGQNGRYTFAGAAGQALGLGISNVTTTPTGYATRIVVIRPNGATLIDCGNYGSAGGKCTIPVLPDTGAYAVTIDPGTAAASETLTLSSDITGTIPVGGAAQTFSTNRIGQNGRYTFDASAGDYVSLYWSGSTIASGSLLVNRPNGAYLANVGVGNGAGAGDLNNLPSTGTYTIQVIPAGLNTGQVSLQVVPAATGAISVNGPALPVQLSLAQNGRYTFTGEAGKAYSVALTGYTSTPGSASTTIALFKPDGNQFSTAYSCSGFNPTTGNCDFSPLPTTGTYTLVFDPFQLASVNFTAWISQDVDGGAMTIGGSSVTHNTSIPGQNARFTFSGTAGQTLRLTFSGNTFSQGSLSVVQPSGATLSSRSISGVGSGSLDIATLPTTGTYTIVNFVDGVSTGNVNLQLQTR